MAEAKSTTDSPAEEWRPVPGWEGFYSVSSFGRVRSDRTYAGRPRERNVRGKNCKGYRQAVLCHPGFRRERKFHQLVLEAFVGPMPEGCIVNHKDCDKSNNRLSNLEYTTPLGNSLHAVAMGRIRATGGSFRKGHDIRTPSQKRCRGERHLDAKLTEDAVRRIRATPYVRGVLTDFAKEYGVTRRTIRLVIDRRTWTHI